jgi:hypothetical protein
MKQPPIDYEPLRRIRSAADEAPADWLPPRITRSAEIQVSNVAPTKAPLKLDQKVRSWWIRRGHLLSYVGLFLFTTVVYFRPYELFPSLKDLSTMAFWIAVFTLGTFAFTQFSSEGTLTARPREVNLILLLSLTALLSIPLGDDVQRSWMAFSDFMKIIVMFIVMVNVVRTRWRLQGLFILVLAVSCYLSINAIIDFRAGILKSEGYRIAGVINNMFQNPNDLALHLVMVAPIALSLLLSSRALILKIVYGICLLLIVGAIPLTYSRAGFLGLAVTACFLVWRLGRRNRVLTLSTMAIGILLFIAFAPGGYGNRVAGIVGKDGSSVARQDDLKRSIIVTARHPLLGVGMSNYILRSTNNTATHNAYTQVSSEMGIAAMVIYTLFIVSPFRRLRQIEFETSESRHQNSRFYFLSVGLQASMVAYMVCSFFASVAYLWNVYYLVAYAVCLHAMYTGSILYPASKTEETPKNPALLN